MYARLLTIYFLLSIIVLQLKAQNYNVLHYGVSEGLPSSEVYDIFRDKKGFLWFATDNGVVKFDGIEMQKFHLNDGLTDPVVFNIYEDNKGRIWFRTYSGKLSYYEDNKIKPYDYNNYLIKVTRRGILNFIVEENGTLHYSTRNIYGKIDSTGPQAYDTIKTRRSVVYKKIGNQYLVISGNKNNIVHSLIFNNNAYPITISDTTSTSRVYTQVQCRGRVYASLFNDVFEYDGTNVKKVFSSSYPIISLSVDEEENIWIGLLNGGVCKITNMDFSNPFFIDFFKDKSVTKVYQNSSTGLWFSTLENGVYHIPNLSIENYTANLSKIKVVASSHDKIYIGDQAGNVIVYNSITKTVLAKKKFDYTILSMFIDSRSNLWISDLATIYQFDPKFKLINRYPNLNSTDYFEDDQGNMWFNGSLHIGKFSPKGELLRNDSVNHVYRSILIHDSTIYTGGRIGLHIRDKESYRIKKIPREFINYKISDIQSINDSLIIISTIGNGFFLFNTLSESHIGYDSKNNFIANNIYSILKKDSLLWLGTEKGLAVIPLIALLQKRPKFSYLNDRNGLISKHINFITAGYKSVWAFSNNGFSIVPDSLAKLPNVKPTFYIEEINVEGNKVTVEELKELKYNQNDFLIKYGSITFDSPAIYARYRLNDGDEWKITENRIIQFSSLAPGKYKLEIQYSKDNTTWYKAFQPILIKIEQPWWIKWYTIIGFACVIGLLVYLYFRYKQSIYVQRNRYLKIINDHQQKLIQSEIVTLERERNRISKELHDGVGTNLTAIKLMVNQLLNNHRDPMANDIEEQFQVAIKEIKDIIYGLTPPTLERYGLFTGLKNYVNNLNRTIPIHIELKTYGKELNLYELNIIVYRIVQELLTNSIKHSFAKKITIHINSFEDILNIIYEDDGIGFTYDPTKHGLGLDNIESRVQSVNGTVKFESGKFGISYNIDIPLA